MHTEMWEHPATQANVATLRERGCLVLEPASGRLTGADSGPGRLPEPAELWQAAVRVLARGAAGMTPDLHGRRVVVSAGGTREEIDPVRFIGNWSSGRQGYALAEAAVARGAAVTLVAANVGLADPAGAKVISVTSARQMREAVLSAAADADAVVMAAAVADYRPAARSEQKLKKAGTAPAPLELVENPDILKELAARRPPGQVLTGFAAETENIAENGRAKLAAKGCDLLVVNQVGPGLAFGTSDNAALVLGADGSVTEVPRGPKTALADVIWDLVAARLPSAGLTGARRGPAPRYNSAKPRTRQQECTRRQDCRARGASLAGRSKRSRKGCQVARRLFTSESVTEGHPDKMADQISDAILDAMLKDDPGSHVAVETLITTGQVHVAGEVTTETYVDIPSIIREKILEIGYDSSAKGYDGASCGVSVSIGAQSPDIAQGVLDAFEYREGEGSTEFDRQGAGDQGLMFGYACRETPEFMPLPIMLAHRLARRLSQARRSGDVPYLRPDGKTQVTIEYSGDEPVRLDTVVVSAQHAPDIDLNELLAPDVRDHVVDPVLAGLDLDTDGYRLLVNPTGRFEIGGPMGDAGLTGRKIIIDTYGGMARHGGGAFSGKDPSKVDRSAAYAVRWVAKNVVAAGLADRCEAQVAYAIGKAEPVEPVRGVLRHRKGAGCPIQDAVLEVFDLRPAAIVKALDLLRPIYAQTAAFGHFGREEPDFSWERTDRVEELRRAASL